MPTYSAAERRKHTMQLLKDQGHASVAKLSQQLDFSEVTIRKDLRALEKRNLLVRTHGGAVLVDHYLYDLPYDEKAQQHAEEKRRIGKAAADYVDDHDTLVFNFGSTTAQVARHLRGKKSLTVTTNSIRVAQELLGSLDVELILLGGLVRPTTASIVGPYAEQMLHEHSFRTCFLGGDGFDAGYGVTTTNALEAHLYRLMMKAAQRTIFVADASKFGRRGLSLICGVEDLNIVITDDRIPDDVAKHFEDAGIELVVV